ncbi:hypothetical protein [Streptomyces sp. NPDC058595]|uniref:hypothetical protein n=1 Tax=Streptomyces sp. NPDC058595 TaxID=3346550 RepID=UPI00364DAA41
MSTEQHNATDAYGQELARGRRARHLAGGEHTRPAESGAHTGKAEEPPKET